MCIGLRTEKAAKVKQKSCRAIDNDRAIWGMKRVRPLIYEYFDRGFESDSIHGYLVLFCVCVVLCS
jgi:hypothetical protein